MRFHVDKLSPITDDHDVLSFLTSSLRTEEEMVGDMRPFVVNFFLRLYSHTQKDCLLKCGWTRLLLHRFAPTNFSVGFQGKFYE